MKISAPCRFTPRTEFPVHQVNLAPFASHHRKALYDLRELAPQIDYVLEFRDCRAPLSSVNPLIQQALPGVPRLTLYSKRDIARVKYTPLSLLHPEGDFRFVSIFERKFASRILKELVAKFNEQVPPPPLGFKVLIAGMPNAGKSSFINKFRQVTFGKRAKKVVATAPHPGKTRAVSEQIMIAETPKVYVIDSPGVLVPQIQNWEHMLKLALIGAVPIHQVDPIVLADYLLFHINLTYPNGGRYPGPQSNDIMEVLWNLAHTRRQRPNLETWDANQVASLWVNRFMGGELAKICFDDMSPENIAKWHRTLDSQRCDLGSLLPAGAPKSRFRRY